MLNNTTKRRRTKPRAKRANRGPQKKTKQNLLVSLANSSRIPSSAGISGPFSQDEIIKFRYNDRIQVFSAANPFAVVDFKMNSVWQPRNAGPTGTCSGFNGTAFRYANYRVENFKFRIRVNSNEPNITVGFGVVLNDTQPSTTITSFATALQVLGSPGVYHRSIVGETSGMSRYISPTASVSPAHVVGNPLMYYSDRDFVGTFGTPLITVPIAGSSPNQAVWASFVLYSDNVGTALTNGVFLDWDAEFVTRAFSVLPLS